MRIIMDSSILGFILGSGYPYIEGFVLAGIHRKKMRCPDQLNDDNWLYRQRIGPTIDGWIYTLIALRLRNSFEESPATINLPPHNQYTSHALLV